MIIKKIQMLTCISHQHLLQLRILAWLLRYARSFSSKIVTLQIFIFFIPSVIVILRKAKRRFRWLSTKVIR